MAQRAKVDPGLLTALPGKTAVRLPRQDTRERNICSGMIILIPSVLMDMESVVVVEPVDDVENIHSCAPVDVNESRSTTCAVRTELLCPNSVVQSQPEEKPGLSTRIHPPTFS
jgi:hypothetical protein